MSLITLINATKSNRSAVKMFVKKYYGKCCKCEGNVQIDKYFGS